MKTKIKEEVKNKLKNDFGRINFSENEIDAAIDLYKTENNRKKQKKMNAENKEKFIDAACWVAVLSAAAYFVIRIIVELF